MLASCSGRGGDKDLLSKTKKTAPHRDLKEIKESGKVVALTDFSSSSYFIYKGIPMGFEYDLLERFCAHIGVELSIEVVEDMDEITGLLNENQGDVIAANYTVTNQRKKDVLFTKPVLQTKQVLVQRLPEKWWTKTQDELDNRLIKTPVGLIGKTVYVRRHSSFYTRLINLMDELGGIINIKFAEGLGTEKLIEMVSEGNIDYDYTVADENVAILNKAYMSNIDISTSLSFTQNVAWACRISSPELLKAFNEWLVRFKKTEEFAVIHLKYFKARTKHKERVMSEYSSFKGNKISPYDAVIKKEAERLNWDWKLLTALIYQESRFVPGAKAWTVASGLMQLIPETAERFGADSLSGPSENIHAGLSFLLSLNEYWDDRLQDSLEVIKFSLASYNVGLGHFLDAVRLAEKFNSDASQWKNVARFLELKAQPEYYKDPVVRHGYCRGSEPVEYVRSIISLWEHYSNSPVALRKTIFSSNLASQKSLVLLSFLWVLRERNT